MPARLSSAVRALVAPVLADRRGVAAVFLAVALIPMVGAVGLAIDSSLGYLLRARMSKSLDAAGLAAGRKALDDDAEEIARAYFDANFGENLGDIELTDFQFDLDDEMRHVTLSAEARMPTYFMRVFGHDEMNVSARTVIERQTTGMELALVMDNTGSMWNSDTATNLTGTPFAAMRDAALNLVDIIYGEENELDNVWVSLVPYVAAVNIGPSRTGWLDASDTPTKASTGSSDYTHFRPSATGGAWKGCVMARAYPWDTDDSTPSEHPFRSFFYPKTSTDNNYTWTTINDSHTGTNQARKSPNLGCGTPITPLTKSRSTIDAGINAMRPWWRGGTTGTEVGMSRQDRIMAIVEASTYGLLDMDAVDMETLVYDSFEDIGKPEPLTDTNGNGSWDDGEAFIDVNGNGAWDEDMGEAGLGGGGAVVVYRLTYPWGVVTPILQQVLGGTVTHVSSIALKNEPF